MSDKNTKEKVFVVKVDVDGIKSVTDLQEGMSHIIKLAKDATSALEKLFKSANSAMQSGATETNNNIVATNSNTTATDGNTASKKKLTQAEKDKNREAELGKRISEESAGSMRQLAARVSLLNLQGIRNITGGWW